MAERITTQYPFIALQDLNGTVRSLAPEVPLEQVMQLEQNLFAIEKQFAPKHSTFYEINAQQLSSTVEHLVDKYVADQNTKRVGVLCLDRDIFENREGADFYRLQLSRSPNQELVSRRNCPLTPDEQFERLKEWAQHSEFDELIIVDDVLAFGETAEKIVGIIKEASPDVSLQYVAGIVSEGGSWQGVEKAQKLTGRDPIAVHVVAASEEVEGGSKGMAIPTSRDLTLLGGKSSRDGNGEQRCYPYFLPFSKPLTSIIQTGAFIEASRALLLYNRHLFIAMGRAAGRDIILDDLYRYAAGIPDTSLEEYRQGIDSLTKDKSMRVVDFIDGSMSMIVE